MSLITNAIATSYYTNMAHNAQYSLMRNNMAQMSLLRNSSNLSFSGLVALDKQLALQQLQNEFEMMYAEAVLKSQKKQKARGFDTFA